MTLDILTNAGIILSTATFPLPVYGSLLGLAVITGFVLTWHGELRATSAREEAMRMWVSEMRRIHAHRQSLIDNR